MTNKIQFFKTAIIQTALFTATFAGVVSCKNDAKPENTKEVAEDHNDAKFSADKEKDAQFLVNATEINLEDIQMGKLAQERGAIADVKELGKMMEEGHTKCQNELDGLAKRKQVTLPAAITDKGQESYKKLNEKQGIKFDKEYCDMMVENHKDAIAKYEKVVAESNDQEIKDWANATLPALRAHLDHAITCQKKCEKL